MRPTHGRSAAAVTAIDPTPMPTASPSPPSSPSTKRGTVGMRAPMAMKYANDASITTANCGVSRLDSPSSSGCGGTSQITGTASLAPLPPQTQALRTVGGAGRPAPPDTSAAAAGRHQAHAGDVVAVATGVGGEPALRAPESPRSRRRAATPAPWRWAPRRRDRGEPVVERVNAQWYGDLADDDVRSVPAAVRRPAEVPASSSEKGPGMPGGSTGAPVCAVTASNSTPSHGLRARWPHTATAARPPGSRTRRISRRARPGSGVSMRPSRQSTAS